MNFLHTKKFRHGSVSLALTVVIIAAVILFNAIFSALSEKNQWYLDMTPEPVFTLSENAKSFLRQVDAARPRTLILDLGGLSFTDSSGIAVLLRAWRHMEQLGGSMKVVRTPGQADKVFRAAGLQRLIPFE